MITNEARPASWSKWKDQYPGWWRRPLAIEWALEWLHYWWSGLAFFKLLELAGRLTILVVLVAWFLEADSREKARHYRAWELISAAAGEPGDLGRILALQDLNNAGVSLAGVPLSRADLPDIKLPGANLRGADLRGANLSWAYLNGADLREANLIKADLREADLSLANLSLARLTLARLNNADLRGAKFCSTTMPDGAINNDDCPK